MLFLRLLLYSHPRYIIRVAILLSLNSECLSKVQVQGMRNYWLLQQQEVQRFEFLIDSLAKIILDDQRHEQNYLINYVGSNAETNATFEYLQNELLMRIPGVPVQVGRANNMGKGHHLNRRWCFADCLDSFLECFDRSKFQTSEFYRARFLIILVPKTMYDDGKLIEELITKMFQISFDNFALNINIVIPGGKPLNELKFFTYFPYQHQNCRSIRPVLIKTYKKNLKIPKLISLYKSKIKDMQGCPLKIITKHIPPFVEYYPDKIGLKAISGIEGEILKEIAKKMNFTIEIITVDLRDNMSYNENEKSRAFKTLQDLRANVTIGDHTCVNYHPDKFSVTASYYTSRVRVVMKAAETYTPLEVLFHPFQTSAWMLCGGIMVLRYMILKLPQVYILRLPRTFKRFIFSMWLLAVFSTQSAYEASYFTFLSNRPLKPLPKYIKELKSEGYTLISDLTTSFSSDGINDLDGIVVKYPIYPDYTFQMLEHLQGKYGVLTKREYLTSYMLRFKKARSKFFVTHDNVMVDILCMYFPRYSYLVRPFNDYLFKMRNNGLINKYKRLFFGLTAKPPETYQRGLQRPVSEIRELVGLNVSHLLGIFMLLQIAWVLEFLVFLLERISVHCETLRRLMNRL